MATTTQLLIMAECLLLLEGWLHIGLLLLGVFLEERILDKKRRNL